MLVMGQIIIEFKDIVTMKISASEKVLELLQEYYPYLESKNAEIDYIIHVANKNVSKYRSIPDYAMYGKCFCGPKYFYWDSDGYDFAHSAPNEKFGEHVVIKKENEFLLVSYSGSVQQQVLAITREIVTRKLLEKGYFPIHSTSVYTNEKGILFFANKHQGKSASMFSSILFLNAFPISGDVSFVKRDDSGWKICGWPGRASIDPMYFRLIDYPYDNLFQEQSNGKVRFTPAEMERVFQTKWVWTYSLMELVHVDVIPGQKSSKCKLTTQELKEQLEKYGSDCSWTWDDVFNLGGNMPVQFYEQLSQDVKGYYLNGDIIQFFQQRGEENE